LAEVIGALPASSSTTITPWSVWIATRGLPTAAWARNGLAIASATAPSKLRRPILALVIMVLLRCVAGGISSQTGRRARAGRRQTN
jgi:hypothetical protein